MGSYILEQVISERPNQEIENKIINTNIYSAVKKRRILAEATQDCRIQTITKLYITTQ